MLLPIPSLRLQLMINFTTNQSFSLLKVKNAHHNYPKTQSGIFKLLLFSNQQSRTQRLIFA